MPIADDYVDAAVAKLNEGSDGLSPALPSQQQTLTLALLMAVCDLIIEIQGLRRDSARKSARLPGEY